MNDNRTLALILLRIYAVSTIIAGSNIALQGFTHIFGRETDWKTLLGTLAYFGGIPLFLGIVLWIFAKPISIHIVSDVETTDRGLPLSSQAAQSAAAAGIGVYMLFGGLVGLMRIVATYIHAQLDSGGIEPAYLTNPISVTLVTDTFQTIFAIWILRAPEKLFAILRSPNCNENAT